MTQSKNSSNRLTLPWPPKALSPNYRGHWAPLAAAKKKYRFAVRILALQQPILFIQHIVEDAPIYLEVEFYPPDNRPRDQDNMIASFKAGQDGLADAWNINDKLIISTYKVSHQRGGMVKVRVL